MSDRPQGPATLEERTDDIRGGRTPRGASAPSSSARQRAAAWPTSSAATYPERTRGLILFLCRPRNPDG